MWKVVYNGKAVAVAEEEWEAREEMIEFMNTIWDKIEDEYGWIYNPDPFAIPERRDLDYEKLAEENYYHLDAEDFDLYILEMDEDELEDED